MITCPNCGHQNPESSVQCESCYIPLPSTSPCPNCGALNQTDAAFCGQCGYNLQTEQQLSPPSLADVFGVPAETEEPEEISTEEAIPEVSASIPMKSPWDLEDDSDKNQDDLTLSQIFSGDPDEDESLISNSQSPMGISELEEDSELPSLSDIGIPELEEEDSELPSLSDIGISELEEEDSELPSLSDIGISELEEEDSELPSLSDIETPELEEDSELPSLSDIETPELEEDSELPSLSDIETPELEEEDSELSTFSQIGIPSLQEEPETAEDIFGSSTEDIPETPITEEPETAEDIFGSSTEDIPETPITEEPETAEDIFGSPTEDIPPISQEPETAEDIFGSSTEDIPPISEEPETAEDIFGSSTEDIPETPINEEPETAGDIFGSSTEDIPETPINEEPETAGDIFGSPTEDIPETPISTGIASGFSSSTLQKDTVKSSGKIRSEEAILLHIQSGNEIELPSHLKVINVGKSNNQIPPDIDVSSFYNSEVVSRIHAKIMKEGEFYFIEDSGSSNGTYVNQAQLSRGSRRRLRSGDRITLGKGDLVSFVLRLPKKQS